MVEDDGRRRHLRGPSPRRVDRELWIVRAGAGGLTREDHALTRRPRKRERVEVDPLLELPRLDVVRRDRFSIRIAAILQRAALHVHERQRVIARCVVALVIDRHRPRARRRQLRLEAIAQRVREVRSARWGIQHDGSVHGSRRRDGVHQYTLAVGPTEREAIDVADAAHAPRLHVGRHDRPAIEIGTARVRSRGQIHHRDRVRPRVVVEVVLDHDGVCPGLQQLMVEDDGRRRHLRGPSPRRVDRELRIVRAGTGGLSGEDNSVPRRPRERERVEVHALLELSRLDVVRCDRLAVGVADILQRTAGDVHERHRVTPRGVIRIVVHDDGPCARRRELRLQAIAQRVGEVRSAQGRVQHHRGIESRARRRDGVHDDALAVGTAEREAVDVRRPAHRPRLYVGGHDGTAVEVAPARQRPGSDIGEVDRVVAGVVEADVGDLDRERPRVGELVVEQIARRATHRRAPGRLEVDIRVHCSGRGHGRDQHALARSARERPRL